MNCVYSYSSQNSTEGENTRYYNVGLFNGSTWKLQNAEMCHSIIGVTVAIEWDILKINLFKTEMCIGEKNLHWKRTTYLFWE